MTNSVVGVKQGVSEAVQRTSSSQKFAKAAVLTLELF